MARRLSEKLTALEVKRLNKPGFHSDGAGLYLRIAEGRRLWVFRYKKAAAAHWMSLGPDRDVTLLEARAAARECRRQLRDGIDPIEARQAVKSAAMAQAGKTFAAVVEKFIALNEAGWKNALSAKQWRASLESYAYPIIGEKQVDEITVSHVLEILEPIWKSKTTTASRLRGRIENILAFASAQTWRKGENPARWKGHLDHVLPAPAKVSKVEHFAALPWADLPGVMDKLGRSAGMAARCLRFIAMTACRAGEARKAPWHEVDMAAGVWTVPGKRMKGKVTHRVPLSAPVLSMLQELEKLKRSPDDLVFPGARPGRPLSDVSLNKALRLAGGDGATVHGMRSTFRDWTAECTAFPREIAEAALAHKLPDKVEAAYARTDHFEKRRHLMDDWAGVANGPPPGGKVVTLGGVRAIRAGRRFPPKQSSI